MQSHDDIQHKSEFIRQLQARAERAAERGTSTITTPQEGEQRLDTWQHEGVRVDHLPDDQQGILRISCGGHEQMGAYCVYRGDRDECVALLEKCLEALSVKELRGI